MEWHVYNQSSDMWKYVISATINKKLSWRWQQSRRV